MELPEGFEGRGGRPEGRIPEGQEPPEGFDPSQNGSEHPDGMLEPPEGNLVEGQKPLEGFDPGKMGGRPGMDGGFEGGELSGDGETDFTLSEAVNNFSGVMDYDPEAEPSAL